MQARSRPCSPCRRGIGPWRDQAAAAPPSLACWFHCRRNRRWRAPRNNSLMAGPARVQRRHHRLDRSGAHDQRFEILATARLRLIDVISHRLAPTGRRSRPSWIPPSSNVGKNRPGIRPSEAISTFTTNPSPAAKGNSTPAPTAIPANIPNHQIRFTPYLSNTLSEPTTAPFSCKAWAMSIRSKGSL